MHHFTGTKHPVDASFHWYQTFNGCIISLVPNIQWMHHFTGTKHSVDAFSLPYLSFSLFCIALVVNIAQTKSYNDMPVKNEKCALEQLRDLRSNINSIRQKCDGIMDLIATNLDVFLISETKIDASFPEAQFMYDNYSNPHRKDRTLGRGGGGVLMYVHENIPSRRLNGHTIPEVVEIMCVEINLKNKSGYY